MIVKRLIEKLKQFPLEKVVQVYDEWLDDYLDIDEELDEDLEHVYINVGDITHDS